MHSQPIKTNLSSLPSIALRSDKVTGEVLETRYVPLEIAAKFLPKILWKNNPKNGDVGAMTELIIRHGFADKPRWHGALNDGEGGIQYGNTSTRAIVGLLIELHRMGEPAPKGIPSAKEAGSWGDVSWEVGEWCIPIEFGMDDEDSYERAVGLALDHNAVMMSGGNFGPLDITNRLYDPTALADLLKDITPVEELVVLDGDALDSLLGSLHHSNDGPAYQPPEDQDPEGSDRSGFKNKRPIPLVVSYEVYCRWEDFAEKVGLKKPDKILEKLLEEAGF